MEVEGSQWRMEARRRDGGDGLLHQYTQYEWKEVMSVRKKAVKRRRAPSRIEQLRSKQRINGFPSRMLQVRASKRESGMEMDVCESPRKDNNKDTLDRINRGFGGRGWI
mmetsp:Transcript_5566/g.8226  ORF Transcript_5566/g.8226 Transcript_5566/m.8226 type:complete len:109 (-) Transcript_5566:319-645(-)